MDGGQWGMMLLEQQSKPCIWLDHIVTDRVYDVNSWILNVHLQLSVGPSNIQYVVKLY